MDPTRPLHEAPREAEPSAPHARRPEAPRGRRMLMGFSWETARLLSGVESSEGAPPLRDDE
jgi:hypothetical protein